MTFYDLEKSARVRLVAEIHGCLQRAFHIKDTDGVILYFSDEDTYIRKSAYLAVGRIYRGHKEERDKIIALLWPLLDKSIPPVRQTVVNAAGEIGKTDFGIVQRFFDKGLSDPHHAVRNAVIGSVKKMGEVNPGPVLDWARTYLHHPDKEIRREICHGIELRGRRHPLDILPLLRELEWDATARVRNTLVHVIGQIAYKKGCLEQVIANLRHWTNTDLVQKALAEIISVHDRYRNFAAMSHQEARKYIHLYFPEDRGS